MEEAENALAEGLKELRSGNYEKAVDLLGKALEKKVQCYGEVAPECAFAYFKYGCALLYKSQEEADVLGNTSASAAAAGDNQPTHAGDAAPPEPSAKGSGHDPVPDRKGKGPAKNSAPEDEEEDDAADGNVKDEEDLEEEPDGGEEDESDLALAWQVLETARCIYEKMPARSVEEADVIMTLADISLEKEEFASSVADFQRALGLLQAVEPPHSRRIAEGYFRLCIAHQMAKQPLDSLASCQQAITTCNLCAQHLRGQLESGLAAAADLPGASSLKTAESVQVRANGSTDEPTSGGSSVQKDDGEAGAVVELLPHVGARVTGGSVVLAPEEIKRELADVESVIADLKEKETELKEMMAHPSLKQMLVAFQQQQLKVSEGKSSAATSGATGSHGPHKPLDASPGRNEALVEGGSGSKQTDRAMAEAPVAVAGRGRKRVAPTPVDPDAAAALKKIC